MVGKKINNYELRELVGDGAMGVVYLAEHPVLRRRVAVKLLKRQYLESPSLVSRFVNEARAAAAIHHPNVIEVIDVGMVEQEIPYIMMEYLEGEPLSRRLTRERLGVGKAVDIAIQAARAVAASHAIEIVHRDLKPENLFLVPDPMSPGGDRVKVLDFGIAKLRPDWSGSDGAKTRTGVIFGTPAYMSPEQCRGLNDEVDATTDIYALGCILYEMLCGKAPYTSVGWGDVLMMHMSEEIPVPSAGNPRVSPAIDKVVLTALAKKKSDRFSSMRDMHRALAQARNGVEDTPAPVTKTDPHMSSVVLGVDALAGAPEAKPVSTPGPTRAPTPALSDAAALAEVPSRRPLRLRRYAAIGAAGLAGIVGLALALRNPAPPPAAPAAAPAAAPPSVAVPATAREPAHVPGAPAAERSNATAATSGNTTATDEKPVAAKAKTAKPHHRTTQQKAPAKW
jgi:serine/threonine protein kinase